MPLILTLRDRRLVLPLVLTDPVRDEVVLPTIQSSNGLLLAEPVRCREPDRLAANLFRLLTPDFESVEKRVAPDRAAYNLAKESVPFRMYSWLTFFEGAALAALERASRPKLGHEPSAGEAQELALLFDLTSYLLVAYNRKSSRAYHAAMVTYSCWQAGKGSAPTIESWRAAFDELAKNPSLSDRE